MEAQDVPGGLADKMQGLRILDESKYVAATAEVPSDDDLCVDHEGGLLQDSHCNDLDHTLEESKPLTMGLTDMAGEVIR